MQNGRFHEIFHAENLELGQGGFGRVIAATTRSTGERRAVKLISTTFKGDTGGWCGAAVFSKLQALESPFVPRYYDTWLEELDPFEVQTFSSDFFPDAEVSTATYGALSDFSTDVSRLGFEFAPPSPKRGGPRDVPTLAKGPVAKGKAPVSTRVEVMDLCEGQPLQAWFAGDRHAEACPPRSTRGALGIARGLLAALVDVHSAGLVHRDVKPANVIVDGRSGKLQLIDFGLAKFASSAWNCQLRGGSAATVGTPGYAAPEQTTAQKDFHTSADVFSAGVVILELLTAVSNKPFATAMERAATLAACREGGDFLPRALRDEPLAPLLRAMLALEPAARPTAAEALAMLDAAFPSAGERRAPEQRTEFTKLQTTLACFESDASTASGDAYLAEELSTY